jgi:hypothetical protein
MSGLELGLQVLVDLEGVTHFIIDKELVGDSQRDQELGSISLALQFLKSSNYPE